MSFEEFEQRAWAEWDRIPEEYRTGVDGLTIERRALPHPSLPDVYTLGECVTESYPSDFGGPDTTRSIVVLYYGSFFRLSRIDEAFDWNAELWETLTHELQHHLESLASDDTLIDVDYAADENFKRLHGEAFDPFFFRHGVPDEEGYRIEDALFIEVDAGSDPLSFTVRERGFAVARPLEPFDVAILTVTDGITGTDDEIHIAAVRRPGLLDTIRHLFRRRPPRVIERDVVAIPE